MTIPIAPLPRTNRPLFFPGQVLSASDLAAQHDVDEGLRRLHHRMLHGWGICQGLGVGGARRGTTVELAQGYALDAAGRELVVATGVTVPVPPVSAGPDGKPVPFVLALRWTEEADAVIAERAGACDAQGAVRRSDDPTIAWLDPSAVRDGFDIVLAEVQIAGCALATAPDLTLRRLLNPPPTPYSAAGRTSQGGTGWHVRQAIGGQPWAVWTEVDTSEAGFGDVPVYLARVAGSRLIPAAESPTLTAAILDGSPYVENPETGRFTIVVPLPPGTSVGVGQNIEVNPGAVVSEPELPDRLTSRLQWYVEWIGVQQ